MRNLTQSVHLVPSNDSAQEDIRYMSDDAAVVHLTGLGDKDLPIAIEDLAYGRQAAVVIPNAISHSVCDAVNKEVDNTSLESYGVAPQFLRSGMPLFEAAGGGELAMKAYFDAAQQVTSNLQERIYPLMTPASELRLRLDGGWPAGCSLLRIDGRTCQFGLIRKLQQGGEVEAHQDDSQWDFQCEELTRSKTNLSMLTYLSDFFGGELVIYPMQILTKEAYQAHRIPGHPYGLDRDKLPPPRAIIKPTKGMVVLFNARFVHRVAPVSPGSTPRLTQSGFILVRGTNEPLGLYH
jgi:2OG-Fe(II) oxygenase superfamily